MLRHYLLLTLRNWQRRKVYALINLTTGLTMLAVSLQSLCSIQPNPADILRDE